MSKSAATPPFEPTAQPAPMITSRSVISILALAIALITVAVIFLLWQPRRTHVLVTGKVIDQKTQQPIANGRVIVTLECKNFPKSIYIGYGTTTDKNGNFVINTEAKRSYGQLFVEASAPDDGYAKVSPAGEYVTLETKAIPAIKQNSPRFRFKHFRGAAGFGVGNELTFVGQGW